MTALMQTGAEPDSLLEAARRRCLPDGVARCPYCRTTYRPHPGFADHRDQCQRRPMNRPHITGVATAPGITLDLQEANF